MPSIKIGDYKIKAFLGDAKLAKAFLGDVKIYSAGSTVTYNVDTGVSYTEEWDSDLDVLSPQTFTPSKEGWEFLGWREDTTASGDVLTEKVMGDEPVTLYAVFSKDVTLTTIVKGETSTNTKQGYYNNGNTANPAFTVSNPSISGATFKGWSTSASSTTVSYGSISDLSLSADTTLYAVFQYDSGYETQTHVHTPDTTSCTITLPSNALNFQWRVKGQDDNGRTAYISPYAVFTSGLNTSDSGNALICDGHWTSWSTAVYTGPFTFRVTAYYANNMTFTIEKAYVGKTVVG